MRVHHLVSCRQIVKRYWRVSKKKKLLLLTPFQEEYVEKSKTGIEKTEDLTLTGRLLHLHLRALSWT